MEADVVVVGGGLAGLVAAATAARAGSRVTLVEARGELGGRARSEVADGFTRNQGAHALYRGGAGIRILADLGVRPRGHTPKQTGGRWFRDGAMIPFARLSAVGGLRSLLTLRRLVSKREARAADGMSVRAWLDQIGRPDARPLLEMLIRTTGYAVDFGHMDAGACLDQVRRGARNVLYLDGGWTTLVDGLRDRAEAAGVAFVHEKATAVAVALAGVQVTLGSGKVIVADAVVLAAGGATQADHLVAGASPRLHRWAEAARPVRAACLDVSLRRRVAGAVTSAYGLGEPTYVVDHGRSAHLAPDGATVVHCLWYEPDLSPDLDHRAELEARLDLAQPGWRAEVVEARFSRRLVVAHDRPQPETAAADRPTVAVDDLSGVFVAGDWITTDGLLADASVSSGKAAGLAAAAARAARPIGAVP